MAELDAETVRHALGVARRQGFAELELEVGLDRFYAKLQPAPKVTAPPISAATQEEELPTETIHEITSSLVGYFSPGPIALKPGVQVKQGDVIGTIAALGLDNEIESPYTGEIVEVLIKEGSTVQFGQVLARIKNS